MVAVTGKKKSQGNMLVGHFGGFIASTVHRIAFKVTVEKNLKGRLDPFLQRIKDKANLIETLSPTVPGKG